MLGYRRTVLLMVIDALLINFSILTAFVLRFDSLNLLSQPLLHYYKLAPFIVLIYVVIFYFLKLYNRVWAYASLGELTAIVQGVTLGTLIVIAFTYMVNSQLPRSIILSSWALMVLAVGGSRLAWRIVADYRKHATPHGKRTLIVGAGDAGVMVARELKNHDSGLLPVGFVDDDHNKQGLSVLGLPVLGSRNRIAQLVKRYNIKVIIIAMPSAGTGVIRETYTASREAGVEVKILPGVFQIINGRVTVNSLRPVKIEDLLHREPVRVALAEIAGYIKKETVLVTGAGGSIGSELCRQIAGFQPQSLVLLGHGENSIHQIWLELAHKYPDLPLQIEMADIRDKNKLKGIFIHHRPGVVFHAAAHKHVPLMEMHPGEAVKTNVFGTKNLVELADRVQTKIFVSISTDKAVNPSSVMGATKRLSELVVQNMNHQSSTRFVAVRFGNVLGSRGSVVPIFQEQIKKGGPVTVTHPDMVRYFMTIPEAVQLVIQAGAMARGGEIFILDMGEPVKIVDLARDMIKLSGLEPDKDIQIVFTGIRPGEKLFEELLTASEGTTSTRHKRIFVAKPCAVDPGSLEEQLVLLARRPSQIRSDDVFLALEEIVPDFKCYRPETAAI